MGANHQRLYDIAVNVEQDSQIVFDDHGIYRFAVVRAEPMDFVGAQAGVEGVLSKNLPDSANALFLRIPQAVETSPELFGSLVAGRALNTRRLFSRHHPFHINHFSLSGVVHGLAEFGGNPGFFVFDHETHYFGPLLLREGPNLLDYFYGTHPLNNNPGQPLMPSQLYLLICL